MSRDRRTETLKGPERQKAPRFPLTETRYGFMWGPCTIERAVSDPKWGVVLRAVYAERPSL